MEHGGQISIVFKQKVKEEMKQGYSFHKSKSKLLLLRPFHLSVNVLFTSIHEVMDPSHTCTPLYIMHSKVISFENPCHSMR